MHTQEPPGGSPSAPTSASLWLGPAAPDVSVDRLDDEVVVRVLGEFEVATDPLVWGCVVAAIAWSATSGTTSTFIDPTG